MRIRKAVLSDLEMISEVERICFPSAEAAGREAIEARIKTFPAHFLVLEEEGQIIGFINGMTTDEGTITDSMFENAGKHTETGVWQSVFGLDVLPKYRSNGYGAVLMNALIEQAKQERKKGCILTCKEKLVSFYERFGYQNKGISDSVHGGAVWYDMVLIFNERSCC